MSEGLAPRLAGKDEMAQYLRRHIDSREWWVLVPSYEFEYSSAVINIEETYFSGEASKDFIAILARCSGGLISVYLARKTRMSAEQLVDSLKDRAALPITVKQLESHDIVFLAGFEHSRLLMAGLAELTGY